MDVSRVDLPRTSLKEERIEGHVEEFLSKKYKNTRRSSLCEVKGFRWYEMRGKTRNKKFKLLEGTPKQCNRVCPYDRGTSIYT